jgi:hypothetical protein
MTNKETARKLISKVADGSFCVTQDNTVRACGFLINTRMAFRKIVELRNRVSEELPAIYEIFNDSVLDVRINRGTFPEFLEGCEAEDPEASCDIADLDVFALFIGLLLPLYDEAKERWMFYDGDVARTLRERFKEKNIPTRADLSEGLLVLLEEKLGEYGEFIRKGNKDFCADTDPCIIGVMDVVLTAIYESVSVWVCDKDDVQREVDRIGNHENSEAP